MADTDGKPQDGNTSNGGGAPSATAAARAQQPTRKVDRRIEELAREYGSKHAALKHLTTRLLNLEEENEGLRSKLPKDGDVVVPKAEADAYRALGDPEQVAARVKRADELEAAVAQRDRADRLGEAAESVGYQRKALVKLGALHGFTLAEVKEEDGAKPGQKVRTLYVRDAADDKAAPVPLEQFARDRDFSEFLPALMSGGSGRPAAPAPLNGSNGAAAPHYPPQAGSGRPQSTGLSDDELAARKRASGMYAGITT